MKITVDIDKKLIQIHGSFKYEDYFNLYKELPYDWKSFEFEAVPVKVESVPWYPIGVPANPYFDSSSPILPSPYKITCSNSTGDPNPCPTTTTCSCSQIPLFND